MAKIKLTWTEQKEGSKIVEIPFSEELLKQNNDDLEIYSKDDLEGYIYDYFNENEDYNFLYNYLSKEEQKYYYDDLDCEEIFDLDELIEKYSYLIEEQILCCSTQTGNYCSICGKKLK